MSPVGSTSAASVIQLAHWRRTRASRETAGTLGVLVLTALVLLWLNLHFGVPLDLVD